MNKRFFNDSPFKSTSDKVNECIYFLSEMCHNYHQPHPFRYNLNAFIQSLRNITFMLQSEIDRPDFFKEWYELKQKEMSIDPILQKFVKARNLIVKEEMLQPKSIVDVGLFLDRRMKLSINGEISPFLRTEKLLELGRKHFIGFLLNKEHSAIGEQIGVKREWVVDFIGPNEILRYCIYALNKICEVINELHQKIGFSNYFQLNFPDSELESYQVLLESDIDNTLPKKWGWV